MSALPVLHHYLRLLLLRALIPLSVLSTIWLYLYPVFHLCGFPSPSSPPSGPFPFLSTLAQHLHYKHDKIAPFRLLVFGDPQLEGDTSLPVNGREEPLNFPSLESLVSRVWEADDLTAAGGVVLSELWSLVEEDIPRAAFVARKRLDLLGNDYYLAHIYRTLRWWSRPTHVTVLGDLLGSQWIGDDEFERRGERFWGRVFKGGRKVEDDVTMGGVEGVGEKVEVLGEDRGMWSERVGCVVGNHDAGYAGDMTEERIERFERVFGGVNWDVHFQLPETTNASNSPSEPRELHLVTLNSLNLDTPALSPLLQTKTYDFLNRLLGSLHTSCQTTRNHFVILLTHLPLHKPPGVCVDAPFFSFHDEPMGGGIREQNHLSEGSSRMLLEEIFRLGKKEMEERKGVVLTGHDHEGCDVYHYPSSDPSSSSGYIWNVSTKPHHAHSSLREITVRSMMGSYGGNAGLLSVWFDDENEKWAFEYQDCALGVQHWWWGVHVLDLITVGVGGIVLAGVVLGGREMEGRRRSGKRGRGKRKRGKG
ncbi:MAG: hypothetical protein M1839_004048 [Geoglossum umbratile]|nr:MAG: hypothetical protein M1839_004048 [Geoglossum umbratile]